MNMDLLHLLTDWGLGHIGASLEAAGISLSDFPTLKFEDLKNVVTNVPDFVYFFEKLEEWRKNNPEPYGKQINQNVSNWGTGPTESFDFGNCSLILPDASIVDPQNIVTLPELNESMYTLLHSANVMQENLSLNPKMLGSELLEAPVMNGPEELKTPVERGEKRAPCTNSVVSTTGTSDKEVHASAQSTPNSRASEKLNLQDFLSKDSDGKAILMVYRKTGYLTSRLRNLLVQKIIKLKQDEAFKNIQADEVLPEFRIKTEEFVSWANEIHEVFRTESVATYYIPYAKVNGQRICASGKLWEHFHYTKTLLFKSGLLHTRRRNKDSTPKANDEELSEITDEDNDKIKWLQNYIEPWSRVVNYWDETNRIRRHNLITDNTSVSDYMKTYRCLQQELGAQLIHRDFEKLYPGKGETLLSRWDGIRTRLSELLQGPRKPKGLDNELLVNKLKTLTPERQDGLILFLLPTLVKATQMKYEPATKKRKLAEPEKSSNSVAKKGNKKPSVLESQEAFVLHVCNAASVEPAIANKREQLRQQGLTTQPLIVLAGPLDDVQASYVVVDNVRYTQTSPMRALDLAFKFFYATDCAYPLQAFHIWLFIQKVAYDITNPGDKFGTNINTLIGEVFSAH